MHKILVTHFVLLVHKWRDSSNNGMDGLKQLENLLEFGVDDEVGIDIKDPLLQEVFLESLKK